MTESLFRKEALEQEQVETEARSALAIGAPVTGVIAAQLIKPGQAVQAGLTLLPGDRKLDAEVLGEKRKLTGCSSRCIRSGGRWE